jgi:hypothetical protein
VPQVPGMYGAAVRACVYWGAVMLQAHGAEMSTHRGLQHMTAGNTRCCIRRCCHSLGCCRCC